jgi:hypothetical protein
MYVAVVLNINFEFLLGKASAQIDSGIWIFPIFWIISNAHKSVKNWRNQKKIEGEWAGQWDLSKNAIKREHWTKTLSVKFLSRIFAQPVRSPLGVSYAKLVSFPIENILFVTTMRSVHKIGIMGWMYLLIRERNTQHIKYSPVRSSRSPKKIWKQFLHM